MRRIYVVLAFLFVFITVAFSQSSGYDKSVVQEVFFAGSKWYLALNFKDAPVKNGDTIRLISTSGFALLKYDLSIENKVKVISVDSLQNTVVFNRSGDMIKLEKFQDNKWVRIGWSIFYGNHPDAFVKSPDVGQSLVSNSIGLNLFLVKNEKPSLGKDTALIETGTIKGVLLQNNQPLAGATITCIKYASNAKELMAQYPNEKTFVIFETKADEFGYFQFNDLVGMNYDLNIYHNDSIFKVKGVSVEPNVINNNNLKLEEITDIALSNRSMVAKNLLTISPNPVSENTLICISKTSESPEIRIVNALGVEVQKINLSMYRNTNNVNVLWNTSALAIGTYIVSVVDNNKISASQVVVKQ